MSYTEQIAAAKALLPANGEMTFKDWQAAQYAAGFARTAQLGVGMRQHGVKFRLEVTTEGSTLYVGRA